ncbi:TPA: glycosyltransferase family 4 protein, partial [Escherichia coli]
MKVLFAAPPYINLDKSAGGVFNEMKAREKALRKVGVEVEYLNLEKSPEWSTIDICHLFMANEGSYALGVKLKAKKRLIVSPIIDRASNIIVLKCFLKISKGIPYFYSNFERCYELCSIADGIMVRSDEEKGKVAKVFSINKNVEVIKIPFMYNNRNTKKKEEFVFFLGDISNPRKNLKRLISICEKTNTKLVVAGVKGEGTYGDDVIRLIKNSKNVDYVGKLSEYEKYDYMNRAKVFALPSLIEGVGLSALEALEFGCNVVITKHGGVRDYFADDVLYVDPKDENDIGDAINKALNKDFTYKQNDDVTFEHVGKNMLNYYMDVL